MSDVRCPYCREGQDINHDDGYGYSEGVEHEQDCVSCGKTFKFYTSIMLSYEVFCDGEHDMEQSPVEGHSDMWECSRCAHFELRRDNTAARQG